MSEEVKNPVKGQQLSGEAAAKRILDILDHTDNVRDAGRILLKGLAEEGEVDLAIRLAHRLACHDASKFTFIEWNGMYSDNKEVKRMAIEHHRHTNAHHLPFHGNDEKNMTDVDIAEWCCDIKARSEEFGTGVKDFVKEFAEQKGISLHSYFYKTAMRFFSIILEPPFKSI